MSETIGGKAAGAVEIQALESTRDYTEYRACFNSGRYYDAHDALEPLWLRVRDRQEGPFLKGLIQLAGAFVHVQRGRLSPARALLLRARFHLEPCLLAEMPMGDAALLGLIRRWEEILERARAGGELLAEHAAPRLGRLNARLEGPDRR